MNSNASSQVHDDRLSLSDRQGHTTSTRRVLKSGKRDGAKPRVGDSDVFESPKGEGYSHGRTALAGSEQILKWVPEPKAKVVNCSDRAWPELEWASIPRAPPGFCDS